MTTDSDDATAVSQGGEALKGTAAKFTMALGGFVGTIVFARELGPTSFGGFYLLLTVVRIANRPVSGWAEAAKKRYSETSEDRREVVGAVLVWYVLALAVFALVALAFAAPIRSELGVRNAGGLLVILFAGITLYEAIERLFEATGRLGRSTWIDAVRSYLTLGGQFLLVSVGLGAAGMVGGLTAASLVVVPVLAYSLGTTPALPTRQTVRRIGSFARYSIPSTLFTTAFDNFDILLLGALVSAAAVGDYQVAFTLVVPATFVSEVVASGLMARVSALRSRSEPVATDIENALMFSSVLSLPLLAGAVVVASSLVTVVYGVEYAGAAPLLIGLAAARVLMTQNRPLSHALRGLDRPDVDMRIAVAALGVNVLVGIALTFAGVVETGILAGDFVQSGAFVPENFTGAQYDINPILFEFLDGFGQVDDFAFALIVFTFFFVDFFDTAGTLVGVGQAGGFLDEDGNFPDIDKPLMADAIGTTAGGILGTSTVTTFVESATGVEEGGRTGMTALVIGGLFLVSLIFVPLATAVPQYASHIALVIVAVLMLRNVTEIEWDDFAHATSGALTIIVMPLTYSIAYGIAAGIVSFPLLKTAQGEFDDVRIGQWVLAALFVVYFAVRTGGVLQTAL